MSMTRTSEYVTIGHPDKVADAISSFILDRYLEKDPDVRYAVEVQIKDNFVSLAGEVSSTANFSYADYRNFVIRALHLIGYTESYADLWNQDGNNVIDTRKLELATHISQQSPDIAQGVDRDGWGDQGIFFGYATKETPEMLPKDLVVARTIGSKLYDFAQGMGRKWCGIDIKTQVSLDERNDISKVIVAIPLTRSATMENAGEMYVKRYIQDLFTLCPSKPEIIVNGTGAYCQHGPVGDSGTTGRKLVVDFYGSGCKIGGGSPWTKDPSKADLSLNLYARYLAREWLKKSVAADSALIELSSCIGKADVDIGVYVNGVRVPYGNIPTAPEDVIKILGLRKPIYFDLCMNGLFSEVDKMPRM